MKMWKHDGAGTAYNPQTEDKVYLKIFNIGYVEIHHSHGQDDEVLVARSSISDAINYVQEFTDKHNNLME